MKALKFYKELKESEPSTSSRESNPQFSASTGWLTGFIKRHSFHNLKIKGEVASADEEAARKYPEKLAKIIKDGGYCAHQIFNVDETGLFWKKMPTRTYIAKSEKNASGFKAAKDRVTLLLCSNASGDRMLKPLLVNRSLKPRALKGKDLNTLPVHWMANKKAWVTTAIFTEWFNKCFVPEVENYMKEMGLEFKILLILDNAPDHVALAIAEIKSQTLNACWKAAWPECLSKRNESNRTTIVTSDIISIAKEIGGEGFDDFGEHDIEELLVDEALNDDDILENSELEDVTPLDEKLLREGLQLSERALKFQPNLKFCMSGYRELYKELVKPSQRLITDYLVKEKKSLKFLKKHYHLAFISEGRSPIRHLGTHPIAVSSAKDSPEVSKWLSLLTDSVQPGKAVATRMEVASLLLRHVASLRTFLFTDARSTAIWHCWVTLAVDDDPDIRSLVASTMSQLTAGVSSERSLPDSIFSLMSLQLGSRHPGAVLSALINWVVPSMSPADLDDEQPFDRGELNIYAEDLLLSRQAAVCLRRVKVGADMSIPSPQFLTTLGPLTTPKTVLDHCCRQVEHLASTLSSLNPWTSRDFDTTVVQLSQRCLLLRELDCPNIPSVRLDYSWTPTPCLLEIFSTLSPSGESPCPLPGDVLNSTTQPHLHEGKSPGGEQPSDMKASCETRRRILMNKQSWTNSSIVRKRRKTSLKSTTDPVSELGSFLINQLMVVQHKGAIENAYLGLTQDCCRLSPQEASQQATAWMGEMLDLIRTATTSPTRRGAGVPFVVQKSATDGHQLLCEAYGKHALSIKSCEYWFRRFKSGDFDTRDKERGGRPIKFKNAELEALLDEDSSQTQEELAETLGVTQQAISNSLKVMGMVQKQGNWVPYELKPGNIERRICTCELLLKRQNRKGFLHRIVTGDEKWIHYDNPKRRKSWVKPGHASTSTAYCLLYWDALLETEPGLYGHQLFHGNISQLLELAQTPNPARVHALNILRALYKNSHLGSRIRPYVADGIKAALIGFQELSWDVRNAATLLFSCLMTRIFGVNRSRNQDCHRKNRLTGRVFFQHYPSLHKFLLETFKKTLQTSVGLTSSAVLTPILILFSRLLPSALEGTDSDCSLLDFVPLALQCRSSPVWASRELSARALVNLLQSQTSVPACLEQLLQSTQQTPAPNLLHGSLLQIHAILREYGQTLEDRTQLLQFLEDFQINKSLEFQIYKQRLTYFGHIMRPNSLEKMLGKFEGRSAMSWLEGVKKATRKSLDELVIKGRPVMNWLEGVKKATRRSLDELQVMVTNISNWRIFVCSVIKGRPVMSWLEGVNKATRRSLDELQVMVTNISYSRIFVCSVIKGRPVMSWLEGVKKATRRSLDELQVMVTNISNWRIFVCSVTKGRSAMSWLEGVKKATRSVIKGRSAMSWLEGVKKATRRSLDELQVMVTNISNWRIFVCSVTKGRPVMSWLEGVKKATRSVIKGRPVMSWLEGVKKATRRSLDELQVMVTNISNWRIFVCSVIKGRSAMSWLEGVKKATRRSLDELQVMVTNISYSRIFVCSVIKGRPVMSWLEGVKKATRRSLDELQVMVTNISNWRIFVCSVIKGRSAMSWLEGVKKATRRSLDELQVMVTNRSNWRIFICSVIKGRPVMSWLVIKGRPVMNWLEGVKKATRRSLYELQVMVTNISNWRIFVCSVIKGRPVMSWLEGVKKATRRSLDELQVMVTNISYSRIFVCSVIKGRPVMNWLEGVKKATRRSLDELQNQCGPDEVWVVPLLRHLKMSVHLPGYKLYSPLYQLYSPLYHARAAECLLVVWAWQGLLHPHLPLLLESRCYEAQLAICDFLVQLLGGGASENTDVLRLGAATQAISDHPQLDDIRDWMLHSKYLAECLISILEYLEHYPPQLGAQAAWLAGRLPRCLKLPWFSDSGPCEKLAYLLELMELTDLDEIITALLHASSILVMDSRMIEQHQTTLTRFRTGHLKPLKIENNNKIYPTCPKCSLVPAAPEHILACIRCTKQDLWERPLLIIKQLEEYELMEFV
ncbi:hypothetical protein LAZ67_16002856 [Cordylochernes scorpioides]|uniref:tRNA (32-2'-O)-methyltransferase regulator THADA n=1 Tax=Cordylochernes scorpioides TaxID=51811 RepID=A0ABY6LH39_9ARAC|nr:hypothetical protein LAZ67_16002856 [Cordylochernes scorpioides]